MPWPAVLAASVGGLEWSLALLASVLAAWLGRSDRTRLILSLPAVQGLLFLVVSVGGFLRVGGVREAASVALATIPQAIFAAGLVRFQHRIVHVFLLYSLAAATAAAVDEAAVYRDPEPLLPWLLRLAEGPAVVAGGFAAAVLLLRRRALRAARHLVRADRERYDRVWSKVLQAPRASIELEQLAELAGRLVTASTRTEAPPRQLNRPHPPPPSVAEVSAARTGDSQPESPVAANLLPGQGLLGGSGASIMSAAVRLLRREAVTTEADGALGKPVTSLDQLYVQATCAHPLLLAKVKTWAAESGGCFPLAAGKGYADYAAASAARPPLRLKYAKVKAVARAIEKLVRVYDQDVSLLVDLCRQSIVFEELADMVHCLKAIQSDSDVVVARVKNRLELAYDSASSAGYRDVALNLRVVTDEALAVGVDTHVCEVQLLLRPFSELKSDEGHKRYVTFRNMRGE